MRVVLTCNHLSFGNMSLFWLWYSHRDRTLFVARVEWDFAPLLGSTRELLRLLLVCSVVRSFRPNICIVCRFPRTHRPSISSNQSLKNEKKIKTEFQLEVQLKLTWITFSDEILVEIGNGLHKRLSTNEKWEKQRNKSDLLHFAFKSKCKISKLKLKL